RPVKDQEAAGKLLSPMIGQRWHRGIMALRCRTGKPPSAEACISTTAAARQARTPVLTGAMCSAAQTAKIAKLISFPTRLLVEFSYFPHIVRGGANRAKRFRQPSFCRNFPVRLADRTDG